MPRRIVVVLALLVAAALARANIVKDIARLEGEGHSVIQGLGLVTGLPGTGDSAEDLVVARPLAEVLRNLGNPIPDFAELRNSSSVALVLVKCRIPQTGARPNDRFDVTVTTLNSASSLMGGELHLAPLTGPFPGDPVYAIAEGKLEVADPDRPTRATVYRGAQMVASIDTAPTGDSFVIVLDPDFRDWTAVTGITQAINQAIAGRPDAQGSIVARALDAGRIEVTIPAVERPERAAFIGEVMSTDIDAALLRLPAKVICNSTRGTIVVTGNVEISPVTIRHKDLTITTTVPTPQPTPQAPVLERSNWVAVETNARPAQQAHLKDLLDSLDQINVPVPDQIAILADLHEAGHLQARLVIK